MKNDLNLTDKQIEDKNLLKCPFCGSNAMIRVITANGFGFKTDDLLVYCQCKNYKCNIKGKGCITGYTPTRPGKPVTEKEAIQEAVKFWNTRAEV